MSYKREASDLEEFVAYEAQRKLSEEGKNNSSNKYRKVLLIAQRTKQLQKGAEPRVKLVGEKPSRIARTEVEQGLIGTKSKDVEARKK